jgi:hypothetical protein
LRDPRAFGEASVVKALMARFVVPREIEQAVSGIGEDIRDTYDLFHVQSLRSPPNVEAAANGPTTPIGGNGQERITVDVSHGGCLLVPVIQRVLYYAQTIDPEIPYSKPAAHRYSIAKSGRHVAVLDPGQMVLQCRGNSLVSGVRFISPAMAKGCILFLRARLLDQPKVQGLVAKGV